MSAEVQEPARQVFYEYTWELESELPLCSTGEKAEEPGTCYSAAWLAASASGEENLTSAPERDHDAFRTRADEALCAWKADCYDEHYTACLADAEESWSEPPPGCVYDPAAARECLHDLWRLDCPASDEVPVMPSACDEVWTCP